MSASPQNPGAGLAASDLRMQAREQRNSSNRDELRRSDALPSLLAFARLRRQERESPKALIRARRGSVLDGAVLDHVLQQVAERALTMTGADGVAIAMRQSDEIICRASVGTIAPEVGTRVTPSAGFSGECLVSGSVVLCDDSEKDARVDAAACGGLGARSMLAVPLSAKWKVIGLIEAFSSDTFGFNDADVRSLSLLAELILAAVRPDEEERRAESARHGGAQAASAAVMAQPPIAKAEERPVWPGTTAQENASQIEIGATSYERHEVARIEAVGSAAEEAVEKSDRAAAVQLARERLAIPDAAAVSTESVETALTEAAAVEPEVEEQATTLGLALPTEWIAKWTGPGLVAASVLVVLMSGAGLWFAHKTSQASAKAVVPVHTQAGQDGYPAQSPVMPVTDLESSNVSTTEVPIKPGETVSVTGLRHWSSGDVSTVAIDLGNHVQYEAHRLAGPERIYFDLHDTKLAANFGGKAIDVQDPLLQRVRVGQSSPGVTRVVLETKGTPDYAVSLQQNPYRLVVEIHEAGAKPQERVKLALFAPMAPIPTPMKAAPAADTSAASTKPATPPALPNVFPKAMPAEPTTAAAVPTLHIALDAGHGGWDLGTVGKTGLLEKDLVLDVVA
ncbi:MAG TPA: GAF domain-containing protein, partial [Terriglobales bacterium]